MLSFARRRMTFANVAMTLALVFAMSGGAYAASKYLITSTKQISPKVLKSLKGANGKSGVAGPSGAAGPAGPVGPGGPAGPTGPGGPQGTAGTNGTNGKDGKNGTTGFTKTLPSKETETGAWAFGPVTKAGVGTVFLQVPVASFAIPLATALDASHVHYINQSGEEVTGSIFAPVKGPPGPACEGSTIEPTAEAGNLCVYAAIASEQNTTGASGSIFDPSLTHVGASTSGAFALFSVTEVGSSFAHGTWAVTAK